MPAFILLLFVLLSCVVVFVNWRIGLLLCVVAGMVQDPIRKVTPDTPIFLTLSFLPIYCALIAKVGPIYPFYPAVVRYHPRLLLPAFLVMIALLFSTAQTLSYGIEAVPLGVLGLFSYAGGLPALFLGFYFVRTDCRELDRPLMFYAGLTSIMLIGTPLEYFGSPFAAPWLGTVGSNGRSWIRWYSDEQGIEMISGFFRSPEIMGWHAMGLVMVSVYLLVRRCTPLSVGIITTVLGLICILLSGRRKMLLMAVIFVVVFILATRGTRRGKLLVGVVAALFVLVPLLKYVMDARYIATAESALPATSVRVLGQTLNGVTWLVPRVGPFGFGVGTRTQGTQHLNIDIEVPQTEGGLEKILVELGLVGTLAFLVLFLFLVRSVIDCLRAARLFPMLAVTAAGLLGFLVANFAGFISAFQVFGDPLIALLISFCLGLLLSVPRLAVRRRPVPRRLLFHRTTLVG